MKFLISLIFTLGSWAHADEWPYDPACRKFGATSETVQVQGSNQRIVLCGFGLDSFVNKDSLPVGLGGWQTMAVRSYVESGNSPMGSGHCSQYGANLERAVTSKGRNFSLCVFFDNSSMEEQTFSHGPHSGFNIEMDSALGIL